MPILSHKYIILCQIWIEQVQTEKDQKLEDVLENVIQKTLLFKKMLIDVENDYEGENEDERVGVAERIIIFNINKIF